MTQVWFVFILPAGAILLAGSVFIIRYVDKRRAARQKIEAANPPAAPVPPKTKTKPAMRDKLRAAVYSFGILLLFVIARILRLPVPEMIFGSFFLLFCLFLIRHLFLWYRAKKLGCAIQVGRTPTAILAAFLLFGLLFGGVGGVMLHFKLVKQQRCSQFTQAVVVDHLRKSSSRASKHRQSYYAVVEFHANGLVIRATSGMGWPDRRYKIGKEVSIRYNPDDLQEILIKGERNRMPAIFIFFGLFFCVGIPVLIYTQYDGKRLRQIKDGK